jgi:hypothetical protein
MLANKFLDDATFTNKTWSEVSGMKVHDLNIMEAEFLEALEYNLHIGEHEYSTWKHLLEECRDRTHMSYYDSPQQQQRLVLMTLKTLGLYDNDHKKLEQQFCDWDARYQHYNIPKMDHQSAYLLPPPVGYYVYVNEYPSCTNLSQSSWDPLAYSLASCQDISLQHYQFNSRSFPWSNSTTWT